MITEALAVAVFVAVLLALLLVADAAVGAGLDRLDSGKGRTDDDRREKESECR